MLFGAAAWLLTILSIWHPATRRAAFTFALCWFAQEGFVQSAYWIFGSAWGDPWLWFMATNLAAAATILRHPAYTLEGVVGALLCIQALIDAAYGLAHNPAAVEDYLWRQTMIGTAILVIIGGWHAGYFGGRLWRVGRRPASPTGMAGGATWA